MTLSGTLSCRLRVRLSMERHPGTKPAISRCFALKMVHDAVRIEAHL